MQITKSNIQMERGSGRLCCKVCGKLFGYVHAQGVPYFCLQVMCECGSYGYLIWGEEPDIPPGSPADYADEAVTCAECGKIWMSMWQNPRFAVSMQCECGKLIPFHRKRFRKPEKELAECIMQREKILHLTSQTDTDITT